MQRSQAPDSLYTATKIEVVLVVEAVEVEAK
jgi:hypothetical protein